MKVLIMDPIIFGNRNEFEKDLNFFVKRSIGRNVFVSKTVEVNSHTVNYILGINSPRIIDDSKTGERIVKFLKFDTIAILETRSEDKRTKVFLPSTTEILNKVALKTNDLRASIEYSLLETVHDKLVELPSVQTFLNPIKEIIISINENNKINLEELSKFRDRQRALRYLEFLIQMEFVRQSGREFFAGNRFITLQELLNKKKDATKVLYNKILAETIKNGYHYIREYLKLTSIVPFLRWSTSYFLPSLEADKILFLTESALAKHYTSLYGRVASPVKMANQINQLDNVGILHKEGKFVIGNNKVFDQLSKSISI